MLSIFRVSTKASRDAYQKFAIFRQDGTEVIEKYITYLPKLYALLERRFWLTQEICVWCPKANERNVYVMSPKTVLQTR